ncbi:filamentous hemagglutinin N-terminal domain-containing protein [Aliarcobacter skirrowii]|uniref:two-partner secretion domain-containing protein n=1 Tax=Aliarcobacter skirrowii TaxID=28200 RepID=UPI000F678668|nr:filamentous hemagglutinin N-terminal domain-containing protein [Aliarcobacter skirrowii]AZL54415.1 filamentous hemagglutinin N-terminal domain-containing protein [Aliarcobacter skirrowii]
MNFIPNYKNSFRILKGGKISLVVSSFLASTTLSFAAPSGGVVTSGSANISQNGKVTDITQSTQKASINWNKFNIASDETVNFKQPNSSSITLNRVVGNEKSIINGALNANGQVWIINSNGVLFGKGATINTSGLLATTKDISDADFQAGNYKFTGNSKESVINLGTIDVINSGSVILAANEVKNEGTIKAIRGKIHLAGANEYSVNLNGNSLVNLTVNKGVLDSLVKNSGTIISNGGEVYLTTNAVNELLKGVVNNTGVIEANSLAGITGHVELFAHGGTANISGTIKAKDGFVETSGKNLNVESTAKIETAKWLLDPTNMIISSSGGDSLTGESVSATAIQNALSSADIELQATDNIAVNENITWSTDKQLKLSADSINVNAVIQNTNITNGGVFFNAEYTIFDSNGKVIIHNINQLQWVNTALRGMYELGSNIDASDTSSWNGNKGWMPIGNIDTQFSGKFDGLGHTISNLTINRPDEDYIGLFGRVSAWNTSYIENINLKDVNIKGNNNVGALVGYGYNIHIENASSSGKVVGGEEVGGLVGYMNDSAITVLKSHSSAEVTGIENVGGLVGQLDYSAIRESYSTGKVTGIGTSENIGGLVGSSSGSTIENSYATGEVSGTTNVGGLIGYSNSWLTNTFYDKNTTKQTQGVGNDEAAEGVSAKTTAQMQNKETFKDWDIEEDSTILKGTPFLAWQKSGNSYTKTWVIGTKAATPDSVDPKQQDTNKGVERIVRSIANQTATTVNLPNMETSTTPNNSGRNTNISFSQGENQMLVSRPIEGQATTRVSLSEARQMQIQNGGSSEEVIVPLSNSSIIQLIDGGVNLPSGVEQEFYLANANTQEGK